MHLPLIASRPPARIGAVTGRARKSALALAVFACAAGLGSSAAGTGAAAAGGIESSSRPATIGPGASAAQEKVVLTITGSAAADHLSVFIGPTGRLTFFSPEGFNQPYREGSPDPGCTQDSPNQVSCVPGHIAAVVGNLLGGDDVLKAAPGVRVLFGALIDGKLRPLSGGPGSDRLTGSVKGDGLDGAAGPDRLAGAGGPDLLRGGKGADHLLGAAGGDALFGGSGPDRLDGGAGHDGCRGGPGRDRARRCELVRSIP